MALLTLLATAVATLSVGHRRAAARYGETVVLDSLADSAIRITILRLLAPKTGTEVPLAGTPLDLELEMGTADVSISLEQGRIDLNTADPNLLYALFAANGWEATNARAMVARIEDWKDADDEAREQGAERGDYTLAGLKYAPRNGPFESVEELRQVLKSADIAADLFVAFTVYSHSPAPVIGAAPESVRRALRFADEQQLGGHHWLSEVEISSPDGGAGSRSEPRNLQGEVVRIRSCARRESYSRCRVLVGRLTGSPLQPVQVFAWN